MIVCRLSKHPSRPALGLDTEAHKKQQISYFQILQKMQNQQIDSPIGLVSQVAKTSCMRDPSGRWWQCACVVM